MSETPISSHHQARCPYCGTVVEVRKGTIYSKFNIAGHTVFVSTEYRGSAGIEHHCDVLRLAMNEARTSGRGDRA